MANASVGAIRLIDASGDPLDDDSGKLNVNATLVAGATIDIGDVDMFLDGGTAVLGGAGAVAAGVLRVTLASDDVHFGTVGTASDVDGVIHGQLRYIGEFISQLSGMTSTITTHGSGYTGSTNGFPALGIRNDVLDPLLTVVDGDYSMLQVNSIGGLYVTGSEVENAAVQSEPLLIGGRYDSSARTLGNGDAGAVALNASGHMIMDVVDGGQLDTIIDTLETTLTAIETDQAAIEVLLTAANVDHAANEVLLTAIDSDTNAIKTAVEILDNAISGSEMQVDVVASLPAGSAAIGKLAANSGVDIGDVDVTSISAGTNAIGKVGHDITGGADGVKTVSSAGTDVVLGGDVDCKKIDIQAQTDNTGLIAVGFTGVDATEATGTGVILYAGDAYSLEVTNLNLIYIDSTVSGEGVRYTYFT
jgi:hypothetical protein